MWLCGVQPPPLSNGGTAQRQAPNAAQQPGRGRVLHDDSARQPYNGALHIHVRLLVAVG